MCGIAGLIDIRGKQKAPVGIARKMSDAIVHRGPDDDGYLDQAGFSFAHRRLSIVGLSDGKQPISNEDGSVQVIFNGEFYDYPERKAELEAKGHRFRTHTDTEIIPHLWEEHGLSFFEKLKGQFAFALHDSKSNEFILARDRFGILPLYWTIQKHEGTEWLLFASEIRGLLASGIVPIAANPAGLNHIFSFFAIPGPQTCFAGVNLLPPGYYLRVRPGVGEPIEERRYFDLDFPNEGEEERPPEGQAVAEYERLFFQAVDKRLRADVPVVAYLSGGVDSATVVGVSSKVLGRPIPTLTVGVKSKWYDETEPAMLTARHVGSNPHILEYADSDVRTAYPDLIRAAEFPVVDTSSAALLRLAGLVRQNEYKVVLTGEGSDEFLMGYPWFKTNRLLSGLEIIPGVSVGNHLRRAALRITGQPMYPMSMIQAAQDAVGGQMGWLDLYGLMSLNKLRFYSDTWKRELLGRTPYADLNFNLTRMRKWHPLHRAVYVGAKIMMAGHLLASKGDRVAMANSVETRPPFLDEDLVAYTNRLHPHYKLRRLQDKYILRKIAEKYIPTEIARRPKKMFRAPLNSFYLNDSTAPHWIAEVLSEESLRKTGYFDIQAVQHWRERIPKIRRSPRRTSIELGLVAVVATQLWHHMFIRKELCSL